MFSNLLGLAKRYWYLFAYLVGLVWLSVWLWNANLDLMDRFPAPHSSPYITFTLAVVGVLTTVVWLVTFMLACVMVIGAAVRSGDKTVGQEQLLEALLEQLSGKGCIMYGTFVGGAEDRRNLEQTIQSLLFGGVMSKERVEEQLHKYGLPKRIRLAGDTGVLHRIELV